MTQKKSSKEPEIEIKEEEAPETPEVVVEGEDAVGGDTPKQEPPRDEADVAALRKQIADLEAAQTLSHQQAIEAQRAAQEAAVKLNSFRQTAEQSQYDSVVTAMGAAQMEIDSAKRDIILSGAAQDFAALADAQERLAAAKAHMIGLEQSKNAYESQQNAPVEQPRPTIEQMIDANNNLSWEERNWLKQHPEALTDHRKNAKLNAAYFEAMDKNLQRGSRQYFDFIEEQLGYREPPKSNSGEQEEESAVMVAAPPSKNVPLNTGTGGKKNVFTLTKEEAEIAKLAGITPQEYVKQREVLREQKRVHPGDYPER